MGTPALSAADPIAVEPALHWLRSNRSTILASQTSEEGMIVRNGSGIDHDDVGDEPEQLDLRRLRISQRFGEGLDAKPVVASVTARKPHRQWWIQTHPDPDMSLATCVLQYEFDKQFYLVDPSLAPSFPGEASAMMLYASINMAGGIFIWPVKLPDENGKIHDCHVTAHRAARIAHTNWVRVAWDQAQNNYIVTEARGQVSPPQWPDVDMTKLVTIAFKSRFISSLEHPVAQRLLGEFRWSRKRPISPAPGSWSSPLTCSLVNRYCHWASRPNVSGQTLASYSTQIASKN